MGQKHSRRFCHQEDAGCIFHPQTHSTCAPQPQAEASDMPSWGTPQTVLPKVCPDSTAVLQDIPAPPTSAAPAHTASPSSYLYSAASSCRTPTGGGQPRAAVGPTWGCLSGAQPSGCSRIIRQSRAGGEVLRAGSPCPCVGTAWLQDVLGWPRRTDI